MTFIKSFWKLSSIAEQLELWRASHENAALQGLGFTCTTKHQPAQNWQRKLRDRESFTSVLGKSRWGQSKQAALRDHKHQSLTEHSMQILTYKGTSFLFSSMFFSSTRYLERKQSRYCRVKPKYNRNCGWPPLCLLCNCIIIRPHSHSALTCLIV